MRKYGKVFSLALTCAAMPGGRSERSILMNILVCIKEVPDQVWSLPDPSNNTPHQDCTRYVINPFDRYALEAAARIKDSHPDTRIVALSIAPPYGEEALREAVAVAADNAYLAADGDFDHSDALAVSYILSKAISAVEELECYKFDAIFCGKQAIDSSGGQVGPMLAELLDYPQVTCALEAVDADGTLHVLKEYESGCALIGVKTPCVITFTTSGLQPRLPTVQRKSSVGKATIQFLTASELTGLDLARVGLQGSPTQTTMVVPTPPARQSGAIIKEASGQAAAEKLLALLSDAHIL